MSNFQIRYNPDRLIWKWEVGRQEDVKIDYSCCGRVDIRTENIFVVYNKFFSKKEAKVFLEELIE